MWQRRMGQCWICTRFWIPELSSFKERIQTLLRGLSIRRRLMWCTSGQTILWGSFRGLIFNRSCNNIINPSTGRWRGLSWLRILFILISKIQMLSLLISKIKSTIFVGSRLRWEDTDWLILSCRFSLITRDLC